MACQLRFGQGLAAELAAATLAAASFHQLSQLCNELFWFYSHARSHSKVIAVPSDSSPEVLSRTSQSAIQDNSQLRYHVQRAYAQCPCTVYDDNLFPMTDELKGKGKCEECLRPVDSHILEPGDTS